MDAWRSSADTSAQMTSVCEEVIEKAMKAREKAELNALDAYREDVDKAVDKASQAYKDKMKQALKEYRQRVMDAWRSSMETSAQMTGIFEEDGNTRKEEQSPERRSEYQRLQFREMILYLKRGFLSIIQRVVKALELRGST
jgi:acyl-CoA reductase-like NAD-dependent aldehyde dehydrogenase